MKRPAAQPNQALASVLPDRPELTGTLELVWRQAERTFRDQALTDWLAICRQVADSGLGTACTLAFLRNGPACAALVGADATFQLGRTGVAICAGVGGGRGAVGWLWGGGGGGARAPVGGGGAPPVRASFESGFIRVPDAFRGVSADAATQLYRAALAHIAAHLRYGRGKLEICTLKPVQVALVSLIEDALAEQLAIPAFPCLLRV